MIKPFIVVALLALAACEIGGPDIDWHWIEDPVMVEEMGKRGFTYDPVSDTLFMNNIPVFRFDREPSRRGPWQIPDTTIFLGPEVSELENRVIVAFIRAKREATIARDERFLESIGVKDNEQPTGR